MNQPFVLFTIASPHPSADTFTFSAKEKDSETGLSYFGSRYYSSDLSIWLSVDPMASKYPSFSPYVYCANNPVKLVDPNGEWPENRAKRFMKRHDNTKLFCEKDGSYSVQYTDNRDIGVVIRLKHFKMNFFERIISKIQLPDECIEKRHSNRGGIFGVTCDPNSYPSGQDEVTDANVNIVNLDALQQYYVPKSHCLNEIAPNKPATTNVKISDSLTADNEKGTSGTFIFFYDKPHGNAIGVGVHYNGTKDSINKRHENEKKGYKLGKVEID